VVRTHGFGLSAEEMRLLRGPLPVTARVWVRDRVGPGSRIVSEHARAGGTSSAIHAVTVADARGDRHPLVLRRYVRADWFAREPDLAEHEARVLDLLTGSAVLAPRLVAVDGRGEECDAPAVLMTRLPGRIRWAPRGLDEYLDGLVDALLTIHAASVPANVAVRPFAKYSEGETLYPPPGSACPEAWARAIAVHAGPPPTRERSFIHRDYHPGNVLWTGRAVSGIVDWASASIGCPDADVGHCRINLARHLGPAAADQFSATYATRAGRDDDYDPYWDLVAAVGMMDETGPESGWLPALDDFVARAVARRATR
jgi:aminoglycoside phosphotransferase (APT) family kinase protein